MEMDTDITDIKKWLDSAVERSAPGIRGCTAMASIVSKSYLQDSLCALQLGLAIFMDKPLALIVDTAEKLPKRLEKIADKIIRADLKDPADFKRAIMELQDYLTSVDEYKAQEH